MTIHPHFVVDDKGRKKSVLLSVKEYNALLESLQDIIDAKLIDEVKDEPTITLEEFKKRSPRRCAR